jgi:nitrate/TMAO reductase-like tetraheme cytochrome c subunit
MSNALQHRLYPLLPLPVLLLGLACPPPDKPVKESASKGGAGATVSNNACIACHEKRGATARAIRDWKESAHARQGIACETCHVPADKASKSIADSSSSCEDKTVRRKVSGKSCAECHEQQHKQFMGGKHAAAWVALKAMPTTKDQPAAMIDGEKGCGGCHRIGRDEGKCDSCHTRHRFSAAEARRPQACATCHMGFDHPQWEMYSTSKHGAIHALEGNKVDWNRKLVDLYGPKAKPEVAARAPVCASCHMPEGDHGVRTAWGFLALRLPEDDKEWMGYRAKILQGLGVLDADGKPTGRLALVKAGDVARLSKQSWQKERDRLMVQCQSCHSKSYASTELEKGDQLIKESDKLMAEAVTLVDGLYQDGILERPKNYPAGVDLLRFYETENEIEQKLYVMFLEHRMRSFQGAFHMNPDYQHWYGWAEMKRDLVEIRKEAAKLRKDAAKETAEPAANAKKPAAKKKAR